MVIDEFNTNLFPSLLSITYIVRLKKSSKHKSREHKLKKKNCKITSNKSVVQTSIIPSRNVVYKI